MMRFLKKYKYFITLIIGVLTFIITLVIKRNLINNKYDDVVTLEDELINIEEDGHDKEISTCTVDIKGEINNPGAYTLDCSKKVIDVIKIAGGLNDNADTSLTNLAKTIKDEMVIIIYSKEEVLKIKGNNEEEQVCPECTCMEITNDAYVNTSNIDDNNHDNLININTASLTELKNIPGIGEAKAKAIIEYRNKNGLFKNIDEIKNVSGIGEKIYEQIKIYITT